MAYLLPAGRFFPDAGRLLHVRVCATNGLIDFVVYNLPAGVSATRWPVFVALGLLETATMYLVGTFCITRLRLLTPGRETAAEDEHSQQANSEHPDKGALVIAGLGGKENVCAVGNCFTRLRIDVRDPALIQQTLLKESGGSSVLIKGNHVRLSMAWELTKFERRSTPVWVLLNNEVVNER